MFYVITKDKTKKEISSELIQMSKFLQKVFENEAEGTCPLPNVTEKVLNLIISLSEHNKTEPIPEVPKPLPEGKELIEIFGSWYNTFFEQMEKEDLFDLVMAANYLDIPIILEIACARVASNMRGKSTEQIREYLEIENS